jgi:ketosteroid isomerase-like protein
MTPRSDFERGTMSADANIETIQGIYEAFGRGDVEAILGGVTDDVDWATEAAGKGAPWYGPRTGPAEVAQFFVDFGSTMEIEEFTPVSFAGNENDVFSLVRCVAKARATDRRVVMDLHHYFRFEDGKIAYYRGTEDTAQVEAALQD